MTASHPSEDSSGPSFLSQLKAVLNLGTGTFAHRELWVTLAHVDLRSRYRGSLLGPLWLTIATGILVVGIGLLYGGLLGQPLESYLPYIGIGIVIWTLIATTLSEAAVLFPGEGIILKQLPVPASLFVTRLIYRNILIFGHNLIIVLLLVIIYPPEIGYSIFFIPIGLFVLLVNLWWVSMILSIIGTRYRDIPPIIQSVLQILFFLTPVLWRAEDLPNRAIFVVSNPFYHLIEIVRAPIIPGTIPWTSFYICVFAGITGSVLALYALRWSRTRLIYWL
jgi:ABC-type polysaccharide/polyol phosphate export permease